MPNTADLRATYSATLAFVPSRDELPILLNRRGLFGCGVEVGVQEGRFSEHLLREWRGSHLISIDPWAEDAPEAYVDIANAPQEQQERYFHDSVRRLAPFGQRSSIWRTTSVEASRAIPEHTLDFVYLDARHDFESVTEDLLAWLEKVRPGGIIAGHDYVDDDGACGIFGVRSAVDGFFSDRGLTVHATLLDEPWISWMVEIPLPAEPVALSAPFGLIAAAPPAAAVPVPHIASVPVPLRDVSLQLALADGERQLKLRLDPNHMSQRMMLECFDAQQLYEAETSKFMVTVLRPGDTFIDVGTHVGYFSMLAAALVGPEGTVVSFEPETRNFAQLLANVELNNFQHIAPVNAAVGAETGAAQFHFNTDNDGGHALWEVGLHPFNEQSRSKPTVRTVDVVSLDRFLRDLDIPVPRVIKIDVEGAEHAVLMGAHQTLRDTPVAFIVAEINRFGLERMGTNEDALRGMMTDLGYETYAFDNDNGRIVRLGAEDRVVSDYVFNLVFRHPLASAA